jgi:hypothetical protein
MPGVLLACTAAAAGRTPVLSGLSCLWKLVRVLHQLLGASIVVATSWRPASNCCCLLLLMLLVTADLAVIAAEAPLKVQFVVVYDLYRIFVEP